MGYNCFKGNAEFGCFIGFSDYCPNRGYDSIFKREEGNDSGDESRNITLYAVTPIGSETDFLKAFPNISYEQYLYKLSIAKIQLMSIDFTRDAYLSEEQYKRYKRLTAPKMSTEAFFSHLKANEKKTTL